MCHGGDGTPRALVFFVLRPITLLTLGMAAFASVVGCVEDKVPVVEPAQEEAPAAAETAPATVASAKSGHGQRQRSPGRDRATPVYIDGELVASLRFAELPPTMPVKWHPLDDDNLVRRFALSDYLVALGVELADVKAVHLHGGRRITALDGDEVRAAGDRVHFQFSRLTSGRPQYRHDGPIKTNTSIDKVGAVAIYLHKAVPELKSGVLYVDGQPQEGIPYVAAKEGGGTRVYVDGKVVAHLKRRHVAEADAKDLASVLAERGVKIASVKAARIVARDEIQRELAGDELSAWTVLGTDGGRIAIEGVAEGKAVDALLLFVAAKPVDHAGPPPDELRRPGLRPVIDDARTENSGSSARKGS